MRSPWLLEASAEQFMIWMHENNVSIVREDSMYGPSLGFVYGLGNHSGGTGTFSMDTLCRKLPYAGLLEIDLLNKVNLTMRGKEFANWLIENGHKAVYFKSSIGGWGLPAANPFLGTPYDLSPNRMPPYTVSPNQTPPFAAEPKQAPPPAEEKPAEREPPPAK